MTIPQDWMPAGRMERVIVHWTAGAHKASALDRKHYHVLIEADGNVVRGNPSISANQAPVKSGYAAHTLNCNSGSIGVSMCCMAGAIESPFKAGSHPMTRPQWDAMIVVVAALCQRYSIPVTPTTVLSHAEVQANLGIRQRGKWDFSRLAFDPATVGAKACGDRMRREVAAALGGAAAAAERAPVPAGGAGRVTASSLNFRTTPDGAITGTLPEGTPLEILGRNGAWLNVRTPAGYSGWVHGDYVAVDDGAQATEPTAPDPKRLLLEDIRDKLDALEEAL